MADTKIEIKDYKVNTLPTKGKPNSRYYVPNGQGTDIDEYITDKLGAYHKVNPIISTSTGGSSLSTSLILGEDIGGGFVVYLSGGLLFKFSQSNNSLYNKVLGLTNQAGVTGETVEVITSGECAQMSGLTTDLQYYATDNGLVTSTTPTSNIIQPVGIAKSASSLIVNIEKPYIKL